MSPADCPARSSPGASSSLQLDSTFNRRCRDSAGVQGPSFSETDPFFPSFSLVPLPFGFEFHILTLFVLSSALPNAHHGSHGATTFDFSLAPARRAFFCGFVSLLFWTSAQLESSRLPPPHSLSADTLLFASWAPPHTHNYAYWMRYKLFPSGVRLPPPWATLFFSPFVIGVPPSLSSFALACALDSRSTLETPSTLPTSTTLRPSCAPQTRETRNPASPPAPPVSRASVPPPKIFSCAKPYPPTRIRFSPLSPLSPTGRIAHLLLPQPLWQHAARCVLPLPLSRLHLTTLFSCRLFDPLSQATWCTSTLPRSTNTRRASVLA